MKYAVFRFSLRTFFVFSTYFTAYMVPEISAFVGLVGSIGLSFLNFLFPIMCYHALETEISSTRKTMHIIYAVIVILSMGLGLYNSITKLFLWPTILSISFYHPIILSISFYYSIILSYSNHNEEIIGNSDLENKSWRMFLRRTKSIPKLIEYQSIRNLQHRPTRPLNQP